MKKLLIFLILFGFSYFAYNQSSPISQYIIKGSVEDGQNQVIPFCNIILYSSVDSTMVSGVISDDNGKFELKVPPGNYYVEVSFLSYEHRIVSDINITNSNHNLGVIILKESALMLNDVVVTGEKRQMEIQFEKRVFNVGKDISNSGENALSILSNVPSVSVNSDGIVSLRGSQNVRILVDGKPSVLIGIRGTTGLRQLQGDLIDKVEVITSPSAQHDAAGEVGIINIVLKKNKDKGINGTFTLNAGYPNNYGGSYSINYRRNKINLFSNYGISYESLRGSGFSEQKYSGIDTSFFFTERNNHIRNSFSNNLTIGLDYYLNENNIVTVSAVYENSIEKNNYQIEYIDFDSNYQWKQTSSRFNDETAVENNIEAFVNYTKKFKEKDRILTADFNWFQTTEPEISTIRQLSSNTQNTVLQRTRNTENEYNYLFRTDYVNPFNVNGKFATGLMSSFRIINGDYSFEQQDNDLNWFSFPAFTNNFIYDEKILAGYLMGSNKFGKFSLQAGLRGEYSIIGTELEKTGDTNNRSYFDFFPSTSLSYEVKQHMAWQLNYGYRINRPGFWDLLPFNNFTDTRVLRMGNPDLEPEYIHSFETGLLYNPEGFTMLSNIYYRNKKGNIYQYFKTDSTGITRIFPINLTTQDVFGFESNISLSLSELWSLNTNFNIYKAIDNGTYQGEKLQSSTYAWSNRTTLKIVLFRKYDFQTSLNYQSPYNTPQGKNLAVYYIDLGLSKKVLNGKGSIIFSVKDMLNTRENRSIFDYNGYYSKSSFQWESRRFMLTFVYRLNRNDEVIDYTLDESDD